jgi:hypothetical protein
MINNELSFSDSGELNFFSKKRFTIRASINFLGALFYYEAAFLFLSKNRWIKNPLQILSI